MAKVEIYSKESNKTMRVVNDQQNTMTHNLTYQYHAFVLPIDSRNDCALTDAWSDRRIKTLCSLFRESRDIKFEKGITVLPLSVIT